ncbi:MAG: MATE family efflux transporter [Bacteroidales bacterium]|nr:MATE family efflux transporter [Bacteroidales bacterium]HOU01302.1 MATE family efflux transporter [Bacteroidales bacterium]HQK67386.1 MATE family efflux transporter [Bacteroidales bacterium]
MQDLTNGNEGKLIFKFAAPMLLGNVFQQLFSVVDSVVVGNFVGKEALAAIGASFPIVFMLVSLIMGLVMGITVIISQYFGARNYDRVISAIDTMYIASTIGGLLAIAAGLLSTEPLLKLLGTPVEIMPQATQYLRIYFSGIIIFFGFNGTSAVLRGLGDSKTPLYFLIIATVVNIILDLLFVAVFRWGIAGAAYATLVANGIAFGLAIYWLNKTHKLIRISVRGLRFDKEIFAQSIRIGLPTGIQQTLISIGNLALVSIVNKFGTNVLAGFSVANRIDMLATIPAMSFSQALSTFVGQNIGAKKTERIRTGLISTLKMAGSVTIVTTVFIVLWGNLLMRMFTKDLEVIRIGDQYLTIVSTFYFMFTLMFIFSGIMRGAGDTFFPMIFSLISLWIIRIPLAYILSGRIGASGIWWAIPAGWLIGLMLSFFYYRTGRWKTKAVVKYYDNL